MAPRRAPRARRSATNSAAKATSSSQARATTTSNLASDPLNATSSDSDLSSEADLSDYNSASETTAFKDATGGSKKRKAEKEVIDPRGEKRQLYYRQSYGLGPETPPLSADADARYSDLSEPSDATLWVDQKLAKNKQVPATAPVVTVQINGNAGGLGTINLNLAGLLTSAGFSFASNPSTLAPQILTMADPVTTVPTIDDASTDNAVTIFNASETTQQDASKPKRDSFMDLPRELRDRIYRLAMVGKEPVDFENPINFSRSAALLRTCKIIHEEATEVLYGENSFNFARSRQYRGKFYDAQWTEVGYEDVRRFLETIGPINLSKMKYISFNLTDGFERTASRTTRVPHPKFVNDPHLHHVFRLIGKHTVLEKFAFIFAGRANVGSYDFHFLNALTDIQCYQLDIILRMWGYLRNKMSHGLESKLRELMVVERKDEDTVDPEKKIMVPMAYKPKDLIR